ncbi:MULTISPECIES: helix-turn-helix domain-containing protein [Sphingomonas]|uniref:Transcriptional regulator n=1 Tax=Sphingomonas taxi TaxID=1549858 RepID=A0A097EJI1_9SPHN|nr:MULTISPECIES: helix-turn-helix domain-containing protein [Sphingomonas]AIT07713.1 transcriptional regulator [Sphingomonas taxi]
MNENIRALFRGISALRIVSDTGGTTCQQIANELGLSRPTVYRILETLVASGLVSVDGDKVYHPTFAVRALENGLTDRAWALWTATPTLAELQKEVVWTCEIATFEDYAMVRRDSMHLENPFRIDVRNFDDRPRSMLTSALGRAYLAFAPDQETDLILRHIERFGDPVDPEARVGTQTRAQLATVREKGYALEQRLAYPHVTSIAAPVRFRGRVLACIDVAWISRAIKVQEGIDQFVPALMRAQTEIERNLERDARD